MTVGHDKAVGREDESGAGASVGLTGLFYVDLYDCWAYALDGAGYGRRVGVEKLCVVVRHCSIGRRIVGDFSV
jgi:hypothetical protein